MPSLVDLMAADGALGNVLRARLNGRISYLATAARSGALRVHPVTPIVSAEANYVFMEANSPKGHDLLRDGRYALHYGVEGTAGGLGEVLITGSERAVTDPEERAVAVAAATYSPRDRHVRLALEIEGVLATRYVDDVPVRQRWRVTTGPGAPR